MKKLILIGFLAMVAICSIFASEEQTGATSSAELVLNLSDMPTRVNCGFTSALSNTNTVTLQGAPSTITLINVPVTTSDNHITIQRELDSFYVWYYISTVEANIELSLTCGSLYNQSSSNPSYIGYDLTLSDVAKGTEDQNYKTGSIVYNDSIPKTYIFSNNNDEGSTISQTMELINGYVNGQNVGYIKCNIDNINYDVTKITRARYKTDFVLNIVYNH